MNKSYEGVDMKLWENFLNKTSQMDTDLADAIVGLLLSVIFIVGAVGNSITCAVIYTNQTMRTVTDYYLFNLAVSDLIATLVIPVELYYNFYSWTSSTTLTRTQCIIHYFFIDLLWNNSTLTMTALSVERYTAICYPLLLSSKCAWRRTIKIIILMWVVALLEALIGTVSVELVPWKDVNICFTVPTISARVINGVLALTTFAVPAITMIAVYMMIVLKLYKNENIRRHDSALSYRNNRRKVKKLVVAMVVFVFYLLASLFHNTHTKFYIEFGEINKARKLLECTVQRIDCKQLGQRSAQSFSLQLDIEQVQGCTNGSVA